MSRSTCSAWPRSPDRFAGLEQLIRRGQRACCRARGLTMGNRQAATVWDVAVPTRPVRLPGFRMAGFSDRAKGLVGLHVVPYPAVALFIDLGDRVLVDYASGRQRGSGCSSERLIPEGPAAYSRRPDSIARLDHVRDRGGHRPGTLGVLPAPAVRVAPPIPSQPVDQLPDIGNLNVSHSPISPASTARPSEGRSAGRRRRAAARRRTARSRPGNGRRAVSPGAAARGSPRPGRSMSGEGHGRNVFLPCAIMAAWP